MFHSLLPSGPISLGKKSPENYWGFFLYFHFKRSKVLIKPQLSIKEFLQNQSVKKINFSQDSIESNTSHNKGTGGASKRDEFSEKFQTALTPPPPSFLENHVANFSESHAQKALFKGTKSAI